MSGPERDMEITAELLAELSEADRLRVTAWHLTELAKLSGLTPDVRVRVALLNCAAYLATLAEDKARERVQ